MSCIAVYRYEADIEIIRLSHAIVGASRRSTIVAELNHISTWAARNNLRLIANKSREMLIRRSNSLELPQTIAGVERVTSMKILGVIVNDNLRATDHVAELTSSCSRGLYALRVLRSHGLSEVSLHGVTKATVVARLLYAAPAWRGFTTAEDRNKLEQFLNRTGRMGYLPGDSPAVSEMVRKAEDKLLSAVTSNQFHVLRRPLPPTIERKYSLRPRKHDFVLPPKDDKNFIPRVLYSSLLNR